VKLALGIDGLLTWKPLDTFKDEEEVEEEEEVSSVVKFDFPLDKKINTLVQNKSGSSGDKNGGGGGGDDDDEIKTYSFGMLFTENKYIFEEVFDGLHFESQRDKAFKRNKRNKHVKMPVYIQEIEPDSFASSIIGLEVGMQLLSIGETFVRSMEHAKELIAELALKYKKEEDDFKKTHSNTFSDSQQHHKTTCPLLFRKRNLEEGVCLYSYIHIYMCLFALLFAFSFFVLWLWL
jgi:hypothetical protein